MKKNIRLLTFILALLISRSVFAEWTQSVCKVFSGKSSGTGSFERAVEEANEGTHCTHAIYFDEAMRIPLSSSIIVSNEKLMITGYDLDSDLNDPVPLGVILDGREIPEDDCVLLIKEPQKTLLTGLTIYVRDNRDLALCDFGKKPLSDNEDIRICRGDGPNDCNWTKIPVVLVPKPEPPCADTDQDGLCDDEDLCNLVGNNSFTQNLQAVMKLQCSRRSRFIRSELCRQDLDFDQDGLGNACDSDADGDCLDFLQDRKPLFPVNSTKDANGHCMAPPKDIPPTLADDEEDEEEILENDHEVDADEDGLVDIFEVSQGLDPEKRDTDGDGSGDGVDCYPLDPARKSCIAIGSLLDENTSPPERPSSGCQLIPDSQKNMNVQNRRIQ